MKKILKALLIIIVCWLLIVFFFITPRYGKEERIYCAPHRPGGPMAGCYPRKATLYEYLFLNK